MVLCEVMIIRRSGQERSKVERQVVIRSGKTEKPDLT